MTGGVPAWFSTERKRCAIHDLKRLGPAWRSGTMDSMRVEIGEEQKTCDFTKIGNVFRTASVIKASVPSTDQQVSKDIDARSKRGSVDSVSVCSCAYLRRTRSASAGSCRFST